MQGLESEDSVLVFRHGLSGEITDAYIEKAFQGKRDAQRDS